MQQMLSVNEALAHIQAALVPLPSVVLPLGGAHQRILAEDLCASLDIPAFPQAGMDGYALAFEPGMRSVIRQGYLPAGHADGRILPNRTAVRIFTGAAVPPGADTVIMQEKVRVDGDCIHLEDPTLRTGANVRPAGSEIRRGDPVLPAGHLLSAPAIAFLAGIGMATVPVIPAPKVSVIVTGNELEDAGRPLAYGRVYDANGPALRAALHRAGITEVTVSQVGDDPEKLIEAVDSALQHSEMVLLTGGVSVGDFDFTARAFEACGVTTLFHAVRQKPGKPLLFGIKGRQPVFGLPGNPASVLTCFYVYVQVALDRLMGRPPAMVQPLRSLTAPLTKPAGLTHFLKAIATAEAVTILPAQESYRLSSFARANALAVVSEEATTLPAGTLLEVILLPE